MPNRHQAIILSNADILSIGPLGKTFSEKWIYIKATFFTDENEFENVCKMAAILSQPQCVNVHLLLLSYFDIERAQVVEFHNQDYIDDLVDDCSNYSAIAMELLQSCAEHSIYNN